MNAKQLLETLQYYDKHYSSNDPLEDRRVVVVTSRPSLGGRSCVNAESISFGFDWEHSKLNIETKEKLVQKPDNMEVYDMASDLIFYLVKEGLKKKKPSWYHTEAIEIFEKVHGADFREKFKNLFWE